MSLEQDYQSLGIIKKGHFKLTSGRHSQFYVDKDKIYRSPVFSSTVNMLAVICKDLDLPNKFVVTGPAVAGAVLAAAVWHNLSSTFWVRDISFVYPEKINNKMTFRRGYDGHLKDKKVLIVEDVITTGASVLQTVSAIGSCGGQVLGTVCILNRSNWITSRFPTLALINRNISSWLPKDCPLCELNTEPLTDPKE